MFSFFKKKDKKKRPSALRRFEAAKISNLTADWSFDTAGINRDLECDLRRLRARSRMLAINDPYFRRYLKMCRENIIGSAGIRLEMQIFKESKGPEKMRDDRACDAIEAAWADWGRRQNCTVDGRFSWMQVQQLVVSQTARDGEIFIRILRGGVKNPYRFALHLIGAEYVDEQYRMQLQNGNVVRSGIECDPSGRVVAYWVWKNHPEDHFGLSAGNERVRIPAEDMIHVVMPEDAQQLRGYPWASSSMMRHKMLNGYEEAEVVAARAGAQHIGLLKHTETDDSFIRDGEETDSRGNSMGYIESRQGTFLEMPKGYDYAEYKSEHPTTAYGSFVKGVLRGIASGLGVNYNILANDYEGVNYSSLRQAALSERDSWKQLQNWIIEQLHDVVFSAWLEMALLSGAVDLPAEEFTRLNAPFWRPRGWQWVDPLKEVAAHREAYSLGVKSATQIAAEQGMELEDVYRQLQQEKKLRQKYGIPEPPPPDSRPSAGAPTADPPTVAELNTPTTQEDS